MRPTSSLFSGLARGVERARGAPRHAHRAAEPDGGAAERTGATRAALPRPPSPPSAHPGGCCAGAAEGAWPPQPSLISATAATCAAPQEDGRAFTHVLLLLGFADLWGMIGAPPRAPHRAPTLTRTALRPQCSNSDTTPACALAAATPEPAASALRKLFAAARAAGAAEAVAFTLPEARVHKRWRTCEHSVCCVLLAGPFPPCAAAGEAGCCAAAARSCVLPLNCRLTACPHPATDRHPPPPRPPSQPPLARLVESSPEVLEIPTKGLNACAPNPTQ